MIILTPLVGHQCLGTNTRQHPINLGLIPINQKVGLFKEDDRKLGLFLSISPLFIYLIRTVYQV